MVKRLFKTLSISTDLDFIAIKKPVAIFLPHLIFKAFITILQNKLGQWDYCIFLARDLFCFMQETEQSKAHISLIASILVFFKTETNGISYA